MRSPAFRDVVVKGLAPGGERTVNASGSLIAVISATETFELALGDDSFFFAASGLGYRPMGERGETLTFPNIRIRNTSANPLDVHLQVGTGEIVDNRAIFGGVAVPVQPITFAAPQPVTQSGAWGVGQVGAWSVGLTDTYLPRERVASLIPRVSVQTVAAGGSQQVFGVNADRMLAVVENLGTETMLISDAAGIGDMGISLRAGERIELRSQGVIMAANNAAFAQQLRRAEILWS